jgi:hypothetical protein
MKEVGRQQAGAKEATTTRERRTKQATMEALQLKEKGRLQLATTHKHKRD